MAHFKLYRYTPETNSTSLPLKIGLQNPKRKLSGSSSNHPFSGAMLVLGRCPWKLVTIVSKLVYFTYLRGVNNLLI